MTFENSKRLYEHYLSIGYDGKAKELLKKYPQLSSGTAEVEEVEEEVEEETQKI